jgi:hypothetical protein
MNAKIYGLQILFLSLLLLESCGCKPKTSINNSNLNIKNNSLLSVQLRDKKFQDVFTDKEIQELNLTPQDPILLEQDNKKNIYQIKVLRQKGMSCGYHAIKNYLWLMEALSSDFIKFSEYYYPVLSEKIYKAYQKSTGCPPYESISYNNSEEIVLDKIKNKQIINIPEESAKYISNFTHFVSSKYGGSQFIQKIEKEAKKVLPSIEDLDQTTIDKIAYEIAILYINYSNIQKLCDLSFDFMNSSRFTHGFYLNVWTCMDHSVCLIINKDKKNTECILADSLNSNFKTAYDGRYLQAIEALKAFITEKDYLQNIIVRYIYIVLSYHADEIKHRKSRVFQLHLPRLDELNLKGSKFYQDIYKKHFINLLNKYKTQSSDSNEAEIYDKLLAQL